MRFQEGRDVRPGMAWDGGYWGGALRGVVRLEEALGFNQRFCWRYGVGEAKSCCSGLVVPICSDQLYRLGGGTELPESRPSTPLS